MIIKSLVSILFVAASITPAFARVGGLSPTLPPQWCIVGEECMEVCEPIGIGGEPTCRLECFIRVAPCDDGGGVGGPGGPVDCIDMDGDNIPDFCPGQESEPAEEDGGGDTGRPRGRA